MRRIKVVNTHWLLHSIAQWRRLDEEPYLIPLHPEDEHPASSSKSADSDLIDGIDDIENGVSLSGSEDEADEPEQGGQSTQEIEAEDADGVMPADLDDNLSPIDGFKDYDWKGDEEELRDFLGSDDDDSESESEVSDVSGSRVSTSRKRERSASLDGGGSQVDNGKASPSGDQVSNGSRTSKRQRTADDEVKDPNGIATSRPDDTDISTASTPAEYLVTAEEIAEANKEAQDGYAAKVGDLGGKEGDEVDEVDEEQLDRELAAEMERELSNDDSDEDSS